MPAPEITSPTLIVPTFVSTTKAVVPVGPPFTDAVALIVEVTPGPLNETKVKPDPSPKGTNEKSPLVNVNTTLFVKLCAEDKIKLFWFVKDATVTVPTIPVPVTMSPTAIVPVCPSTTKLVVLFVVPLTDTSRKSDFVNVNTTLSERFCAEDKTKLF